MHGIGLGQEFSHQGMARLVIGNLNLFLLADEPALALDARDHPIDGIFKVFEADRVFTAAGRQERGLIAEIL